MRPTWKKVYANPSDLQRLEARLPMPVEHFDVMGFDGELISVQTQDSRPMASFSIPIQTSPFVPRGWVIIEDSAGVLRKVLLEPEENRQFQSEYMAEFTTDCLERVQRDAERTLRQMFVADIPVQVTQPRRDPSEILDGSQFKPMGAIAETNAMARVPDPKTRLALKAVKAWRAGGRPEKEIDEFLKAQGLPGLKELEGRAQIEDLEARSAGPLARIREIINRQAEQTIRQAMGITETS